MDNSNFCKDDMIYFVKLIKVLTTVIFILMSIKSHDSTTKRISILKLPKFENLQLSAL